MPVFHKLAPGQYVLHLVRSPRLERSSIPELALRRLPGLTSEHILARRERMETGMGEPVLLDALRNFRLRGASACCTSAFTIFASGVSLHLKLQVAVAQFSDCVSNVMVEGPPGIRLHICIGMVALPVRKQHRQWPRWYSFPGRLHITRASLRHFSGSVA